MRDGETLHIGYDAKRAFFNKSGLGNYSRDLIRILSVFKPENQYTLFRHKAKHGVDFKIESNTNIVYPDSKFYKKYSSIWRSAGISKQLKRSSLDIYHGLSHELPLGIEKSGVKTVVTMHDCIFLRYPELYDLSFRLIFKKKYAHACKVADRIIAISEQTKADVMQYFNVPDEKIDVVYQGCNPIFYESATAQSKKHILEKYNLPKDFMLSVGTIEERKNILSIFQAMTQKDFNIPLVSIGRETKYLEKVKSFVADHKLEKNAIFLHNVATADLPALYQMAKLFVYPSLFEGFGIPILEALNSGTPVITTKGSCFPEVGGDAALYVDYGNTEQLTASIDGVLKNPSLQLEMAKKGKKQALLFREKAIANATFEVYYKAMQTR